MTNVEKCNNTSVGMIVRKDNKILLIERKKFPFGFAPPAGHVDSGEEYEFAAKRELSEEVGIKSDQMKLLVEGRKENKCRHPGGDWHYWKIYQIDLDNDCDIKTALSEVKQANWYSLEEIKKLAKKTEDYRNHKISDEEWEKSPGIEPVWYDWFKELKIL